MTKHPSISLYLHVPFCRVICSYCAFNTYAGMEDRYDAFVDALVREIHHIGHYHQITLVKSVFFGGGTPSLLTVPQYTRIFAAVHEHFSIDDAQEIALEANPDDLTPDYLRGLRDLGFNRISIGVQSMRDQDLRLFKREHDTPMIYEAVRGARGAGFENVNLDLMYGIPDQTLADWRTTLDQTLALQPDGLSVYGLMLEGNTPLKDAVDVGAVPRPDDDLAADMYELATDHLGAAGFVQYEISNWSLPGRASAHNLQYWHNLPYAGLGPGAHGYLGGMRTIALRAPQKYIDVMRAAPPEPALEFPRTPATSKAVTVQREQAIAETIMMNLRMVQNGIHRPTFRQRFGVDVVDLRRESIDKHVAYGTLTVSEDAVRLSRAGRLVSNAVIADLI